MENKIKDIISSVLGIENNLIEEDASSVNVVEWDSLKHMNIVIAIEDEFDIKFTQGEIVKLMSYKAIVSCVSGKLN